MGDQPDMNKVLYGQIVYTELPYQMSSLSIYFLSLIVLIVSLTLGTTIFNFMLAVSLALACPYLAVPNLPEELSAIIYANPLIMQSFLHMENAGLNKIFYLHTGFVGYMVFLVVFGLCLHRQESKEKDREKQKGT